MSSIPSPTEIRKIFNSVTEEPTKPYGDKMDEIDPLKRFRDEFIIPPVPHPNKTNRIKSIYFHGFGLGLQPKRTLKYLKEVCDEWGNIGSLSYESGKRPLIECEVRATKLIAPLLDADISEVCLMNSCSVNANLLMMSFYKPTSSRYKILIEDSAFCSDYHVIQGQLQLHNLTIDQALIEIKPSNIGNNKYYIHNNDIINTIHKHNTSISLIWLGCTQYLFGQLFDIERICNVAHKYGIYVGLDCAHGIGNIPLFLHKWDVDCATFCGYKYLSGSGGGIGGIFVHQKHHHEQLTKLRGWWGQDLKDILTFSNDYKESIGSKSWSISQNGILECVALESSLEIFEEANIHKLRVKSIFLTKYLQILIQKYLNKYINIITPLNENERGCQLTLEIININDVDKLTKYIEHKGVICYTRKPNIMRVAPMPLYNTFSECWDFVQIVKSFYDKRSKL